MDNIQDRNSFGSLDVASSRWSSAARRDWAAHSFHQYGGVPDGWKSEDDETVYFGGASRETLSNAQVCWSSCTNLKRSNYKSI